MQKTNSSDLPLVAIDYIDLVIKAMKYRKKVRADVREELIAHFTDSLGDCTSDNEKQQAVETLIADFGDAKLLGKLLRRAKKRCRPLWRTMVARTFQSIGICAFLLALYIGWFFTGKPVISTDYLEVLNQQVRPVADDSHNAWPFYKQAAEKYIESENEDFDFHPANPSFFTRSEQDLQVIRQAISDNHESFELIQQGNEKPYYWQIYAIGEGQNELLAMLLPHLSDYRELTYLMCWEGLLNAEEGNLEKSFSNLLDVYSFGQHLRGQKITLIEQLVAMSIEGISTNTLRIILAEYNQQIDAILLNSVRERFSEMITEKNFTADYSSEKLFMYDEAQRCFTESRFGKSHLYLPRIKDLAGAAGDDDIITAFGLHPFQILFTHPGREKTLEDIGRFYAEREKITALTPALIKSKGSDADPDTEDMIKKNIFLNMLLPALSKVSQMAWRGRTESEAMLVILAITQYQKEHGRFPDSLDVLVDKGLLNEVPIDPYSDKALVYRTTHDGFTLYSVGYNFIDDGGVQGEYKGTNKNPQSRRWTNDGDAVFWPVQSVNSQR
ncbi:MAG: hypothetical protein ACYSUS_04015 [Planctomycetota bacterium]|jgi:hypothetical protein